MATVAAARSIFRSPSLRNATTKVTSGAGRAARRSAPFRRPSCPPRFAIRYPAEMSSFCVESLLPRHSVTASVLMTSLLTMSRRRYDSLLEGL